MEFDEFIKYFTEKSGYECLPNTKIFDHVVKFCTERKGSNRDLDEMYIIFWEYLKENGIEYIKEKNIPNLPEWFKEKYKLELERPIQKNRYWVELEDVLHLLRQQ